MKTKFGAIIVAGSGKIGGHVASKNRAGSYLRTKVTPVNPQTVSQSGVRNLFTSLSQAWKGLTQAQRDAWNAAVADYARTDIFGDLRNPSGFNLYQRLNNVLSNVGEEPLNVPPLPSAVAAITADSLNYAVTVPTLTLIINAVLDVNTALLLFATAPTSAGKSFIKSEYRQIDVIAPEEGNSLNILASYLAKFGSVGAIGQKIFIKIVSVNINTGQTGSASSISTISVA